MVHRIYRALKEGCNVVGTSHKAPDISDVPPVKENRSGHYSNQRSRSGSVEGGERRDFGWAWAPFGRCRGPPPPLARERRWNPEEWQEGVGCSGGAGEAPSPSRPVEHSGGRGELHKEDKFFLISNAITITF